MPKLKRKSISQKNQEDRKRMRVVRAKSEDKRKQDQVLDARRRVIRRKHVVVKEKEQFCNTLRRSFKRSNPETRNREQKQNSKCRKLSRANSDVRQRELTQKRHRYQRSPRNSKLQAVQQRKNTKAKKISRKYQKSRNSYPLQNVGLDNLIHNFKTTIKDGPTSICSCCGGLWFPSSVFKASLSEMESKGYPQEYLDRVFCVQIKNNDQHYFCFTCNRNIKSGKVPRLSLSNGLAFPDIPEPLQGLTQMEERLCALRLPFLQIRSLGVDRQCGLKGNVVHVYNSVQDSISIFPRRMEEAGIIHIKLVRMMAHEHHYLFQSIRPEKVIAAVNYLMNTPLYIEEKASISTTWEEDMQRHRTSQDFQNIPNHLKVEESLHEEESEGQETMILEAASDFIKYAPGEGKKPLSLINDLNGEVASYPTIYCGIPRNLKAKLSYTDIAKSETRRYDRRCANPAKLLHAFKISQNHQVVNAVSTCLRKKRGNKIKARDLLNPSTVKSLIDTDVGFQLLKQVRTSPAFWEKKSKHILAMIRQLGIPTFFVTLSAAETHWPELLIVLSKVLDGRVISEIDVESMKYEEKASLIRRDPVTCSRYFDYRLRQCFKYLLLPINGVFGKYRLVDYFVRIEFQHRGSPHAHMLFWLEGSPLFSEETQLDCVNFIDEFISCDRDTTDVIHQQHRHTKTCQKNLKDKTVCRFNIPYPPMPRTSILLPYPATFPKSVKIKYQANLARIKSFLETNKNSSELSFEDLLELLEMNLEEYLETIRSSIKKPTVFLKRDCKSSFTNACLKPLASAWRSNMDIQFILDPYGCAKYVTSYISKSSGGISKLLKATVDETKKGNLSLLEKMRKLGNTFLNCSEISAQEAAYGVLGMPLTKSTRDEIFVPTGPPNERTSLVKSAAELANMNESSTNVLVAGLLDHYVQRPEDLETVCLADFAANYVFSTKPTSRRKTIEEEFDPEHEEECERKSFELLDGSGFIRHKKRPKVIRFRRYSEAQEPDNYYREQLMLYVPWRCEELELPLTDTKPLFVANQDLIKCTRNKYEKCNEILKPQEPDSTLTQIEPSLDKEYGVLFNDHFKADIFKELGIDKKTIAVSERFPYPNLIEDSKYEELIACLNQRQLQYVLHCTDLLDQNRIFLEFVYGGAGVGKSTVINAIVQTLIRIQKTKVAIDLELLVVLLIAPTGMAAFNIRGATAHHALGLPFNQTHGPIPPLPEDTRNSMASRLRELKLLVIDEISMVSAKTLNDISLRMQQIFKSSEYFGGIAVTIFGDLRQLRPVGADYVFGNLGCYELKEFVGNPIWESFSTFELIEIMRQKDDRIFAEALNRLSKGQMTIEDIQLFKSREITDQNKPPDDAVRLYSVNKAVNDYNALVLESSNAEKGTSLAVDMCEGVGKAESKARQMESVKGLPHQDTMGLPETLLLVLDKKYMITMNLNVLDGLVNGATGILKEITYYQTSSKLKIPSIAWLQFPDISVGATLRKSKTKMLRPDKVSDSLVPIQFQKAIIKRLPGTHLSVVRAQFPLVPAEAITIHKAQGSTKDAVVVSVKQNVTRQGLYVACSRARSLDGLYIDGEFRAPNCHPNDRVEAEITKWKSREIQFDKSENMDVQRSRIFEKTKRVPVIKNASPENKIKVESSNSYDMEFNSVQETSLMIKRVASGCTGPPLKIPKQTPCMVLTNPSPVQIGRFVVFQSDLQTLEATNWLSDAIVDGYAQFLCNSTATNGGISMYNFGSFFHTYLSGNVETLNPLAWCTEVSHNLLLFPLCRNRHWTVVVADRRNRCITSFDSLQSPNLNNDVTNLVRKFLVRVDQGNSQHAVWKTDEFTLPVEQIQVGGTECGVYVCAFILSLATNSQFNFSMIDMPRLRNVIKNSILARRVFSLL